MEKSSYYKVVQTIEFVINQIENDMPVYLRYLEDVFPYMGVPLLSGDGVGYK